MKYEVGTNIFHVYLMFRGTGPVWSLGLNYFVEIMISGSNFNGVCSSDQDTFNELCLIFGHDHTVFVGSQRGIHFLSAAHSTFNLHSYNNIFNSILIIFI